jgi:hypothetical protein
MRIGLTTFYWLSEGKYVVEPTVFQTKSASKIRDLPDLVSTFQGHLMQL